MNKIPDGQLLANGWSLADDYTKDVLRGAVFMRQLGGAGTPFVLYDLTILKSDSGEWIPVHGIVKMPAVASPEDAAAALADYWENLPDIHKRRAGSSGDGKPESVAVPVVIPEFVERRIALYVAQLSDHAAALTGVQRARGNGHILALELADRKAKIQAAYEHLSEIYGFSVRNKAEVQFLQIVANLGMPDLVKFGFPQTDVPAWVLGQTMLDVPAAPLPSLTDIFYIVPAWSDQAGQCKVVTRKVSGPVDASASYRASPGLWKEAGLMNSRGKLVCLNDKKAFAEMSQDEPLSAGMQYSFPATAQAQTMSA